MTDEPSAGEPEAADRVESIGPVGALVRRWTVLAVLPLFSAWYLWQATTIELPDRQLVVSPRAFPTFVGVLMVLVVVALAVRELAANRGTKSEPGDSGPSTGSGRVGGDPEDEVEAISSWRDTWVVVGSLVVYVVLFGTVGYLLSTLAMLFGLSTYFARRRWRRNLIVSAVFTGATWYLFGALLSVQLPSGLIPLEL